MKTMKSDNPVSVYLSMNGKKGGSTTLKKYGKEHFRNISILAIEARRLKISENKDNIVKDSHEKQI